MKRVARNTFLTLCLLLTTATIALWIRSHWVSDIVVYDLLGNQEPLSTHFELVTIPGQMRITVADGWFLRCRCAQAADASPVAPQDGIALD